MKARYFVRVRLPTHWSTFAIVGPGKGSQAVANNVRQILLDQPGWPYEVRVFPTHAIPPWRGSRRRRIERAELQSEVEWDQDVVAAILAKARRGRRRDMIGLTPTPRQPKGRSMTNFSPPGLCEHGRAIRSTEETLSYAGAIDQCACCDHLYGNFDPHMPRGDDRVRYCHSCRGRDAFTKGPPGTLADGFNEIIGVRDHDRTAVPLVPGLQASK